MDETAARFESTQRRILVHVVDPDRIACETLSIALQLEDFDTDYSIDMTRLIERLQKRPPDVIITSVRLGSIATCEVVTRTVRAAGADIPTIALCEPHDAAGVLLAQQAGAAQVLIMPITGPTLVDAIERAVPAPAEKQPARETIGFPTLTPRERQVLGQITDGNSNSEAGRSLGISPRTIETHRRRIMEKLNARNTADLIRIVLTGGRSSDDRPSVLRRGRQPEAENRSARLHHKGHFDG